MTLSLSVVLPLHNEEEAAGPFLAEIFVAAQALPLLEVVCVDDGSSDGTLALLKNLGARFEKLRIVRHGARAGQSAAIVTGVRAARGDLIVTLDGDGQNDPADIASLYRAYVGAASGSGPVLVAGQRAQRRDDWVKRFSSRIANAVRARLLDDGVRDTGCGLKLFARADFLRLPSFNHMHRFLPALFRREGGRVLTVAVNHRARAHGRSKYGLFDRLWVGLVDLAGVYWLTLRPLHRGPVTEEV